MSLLDEFKACEAEYKKSLRAVTLYSFLAYICMLGMPIFMMQVYRNVLVSRSMDTLIAIAIIALILLVAFGFFDSLKLRLLSRAAINFEAKISGSILAAEMSRQTDTRIQTLHELTGLRQLASSPGFAAIFDLPIMPAFMAIIFIIHPILGGVLVVGAVVLVAIAFKADRVVAPKAAENLKARQKSHRTLQMYMGSQEIVKAQGMYNEVVNAWGASNREVLSTQLDSGDTTTVYSSTSKAARQILQVALIGFGALLVLNGLATAGVIFAASIIGSRALQPIEQLVGSWSQLKQGVQMYKDLTARLEHLSLPGVSTPLPKPKGALTLERVGYVPAPGAQPIIKSVSGRILAGESVAIIGPSGAGKSTLVKLMAGSIEATVGSIALDGQDLKAWDPRAKGLFVGYMPQNVTFFDATIRENIARLRVDDPVEFAIKAAKLAGVHDMIVSMPQGYDTVLSSGEGFKPSGGQSQLIALARAFYGDPSVLILDEPNASLDQAGEATFHKALGTAKKMGITVVMVTQRPSALKYTDKVMVMDAGVVKEYGPRDEVVKPGNQVGGPSVSKRTPQQAKAASSGEPSKGGGPGKPVTKITASPPRRKKTPTTVSDKDAAVKKGA